VRGFASSIRLYLHLDLGIAVLEEGFNADMRMGHRWLGSGAAKLRRPRKSQAIDQTEL